MKPYYSLSDFPDRKNAGKNFIARCPKCGTMHLYISKAKGLYHCFYAGCEFNGILTDYCKDKRPMFSYPKENSSDRTGTCPPPGMRHLTGNLPEYRNATENSVNEVPMLPGDYKILSPAVLQKIKPLDESPECTDPDQLAARRYLADQGISLATAIATHIGCLRHYCITKNSEDKREQASSVFPCIAYVNYVDGRPVNAKYRSCSPSPSAKTVTAANASAVSGEIEIPDGTTEESSVTYSKFWSQDSPTKPCAPYNIDCINPLLVEEETIPRLIIVEGEKEPMEIAAYTTDDGREVLIKQTMRYENKTQINRIEWHYFINGEFNSIQNLDMRMFFPQELHSCLEWNGFSIIHKYGGFEEEVFNDNSGKQVFVCQYKSDCPY